MVFMTRVGSDMVRPSTTVRKVLRSSFEFKIASVYISADRTRHEQW